MTYSLESKTIIKLDTEKALNCLKPREKEIIEIRFLDSKTLTFREIIQEFGLKNCYGKPLSKARLQQIQSKALSKLKRRLEKMKYCKYER